MKHTPGPWKVNDAGDTVFIEGVRNGEHGLNQVIIAMDLYDEDTEPTLEELYANARLIASAPDYHEYAYMLAMLVLQSNLYQKDTEIREAVDNVLNIWRRTEGRI